MTAEVAILNRNAIALAADSAVTVGEKKIYNSALKLFSLSKVAPVAIMIFGNAMLLGMPWETLVKSYRKELGNKVFNTIDEYANDFLAFIPRQSEMFPKKAREDWAINCAQAYLVGVILKEIGDSVDEYIKNNGKIDEPEIEAIVVKTIDDNYKTLKEKPRMTGLTVNDETSLLRKFSKRYTSLIVEYCETFDLSASLFSKLRKIFCWTQTREIWTSEYSGIVIAGFGEREYFPSVRAYQIDGVLDKKLIYKKKEEKSKTISRETPASIVPFAQDDMVASFMAGMNTNVNVFLHAYLQRIFARIGELVSDDELTGSDKAKQKFRRRFQKNVEKISEDFFEELEKHKQADHVAPIMAMVQVLPKDELAAMAESLVNLTAFKRRMTTARETVGGPVDVAVISKGDGLVWVKRKLYFPSDINYGFHSNYMRGIDR